MSDSWDDEAKKQYNSYAYQQGYRQQGYQNQAYPGYNQSYQQMEQQTARLNLGSQQNFNVGASEFVPSWMPQQPAVPQYQQFQSYQAYQQPQAYQQYQPYQPQAYQAYQPQQQAYQRPYNASNGTSWNKDQQTPAVSKTLPTTTSPPRASAVKLEQKKDEPKKEETKKEEAKKEEPKKEETKKESKKEETKKEEPVKHAPKKTTVSAPVAKDPDFSDIKDDGKETLNIIFIGHVDAGKSTMSGHLLYLTGMVDKRTMDKYQQEAKDEGKESWYLSWVMDLNEEERSKGKTVEYGRGFFETEKRRFTILDAPGHKLYVPSMLSGAAQADVGILVLSARKGEFETGFERGGQTREHAMLAKTAGVKKLLCVVNKMDDPTVLWSKERYDEIVGKINPFLKQAGFKEKKDLEYVPVSGFSGDNLKDRLTKEKCPWYDGPSLLELLDNMDIGARKFNAPLMMPISDRFKDMGTIITGKIESGRVRKGQQVLIMPNRKVAEILTIYLEDQENESAKSGDNVRIRLKNVEEEDISPGFVMCGQSNPVHTVTAFEAEIGIVEHKSIICAGWNCVLHIHTAVEEISISSLLHMVDKKSGRKSKNPPKFIKQGDKAIVKIEGMGGPICVEPFANYEQLGRFTLRDEGRTVAIGKVTKLIEQE